MYPFFTRQILTHPRDLNHIPTFIHHPILFKGVGCHLAQRPLAFFKYIIFLKEGKIISSPYIF